MEFCKHFKSVHVQFDPATEKMEIARCCMKSNFPIAEFSIDDWEKIENKLDFLNSFVDVWPEGFEARELRHGHCEEFNPKLTECYYDKHIDRFERFEIAIDMSCNANCTFCGFKEKIENVRQKKLNKTLKNLYFKVLNDIIDNINYPCELRLTDHGEPLLWKAETLEILKKVEGKKDLITLQVTTNGTGLCDQEILQALKRLDAEVGCSLNALSAEYHRERMGLTNFNEIISAIEENKLPVIFTYVVSSQRDVDEFNLHLEEFRKICPTTSIAVYGDCFDLNVTNKLVDEIKQNWNHILWY